MTRASKTPLAENDTPVLSTVTAIWKDLLGQKEIAPDANFFDLGGDSIMALNMLFEINEALGIDLPPGVLFDYPELNKFCDYIDELQAEKNAIAAE